MAASPAAGTHPPQAISRLGDERAVQRAFAWCGVGFLVLLGVGLLLPGWIPPSSPAQTARQVADEYQRHHQRIRVGVLLMTVGTGLLIPFVVAMSRQMRRIGGAAASLAVVELIAGSMVTMIFLPACMFWEVAAYRPERDPQLTQALNDLGWLPFAGITTMLLVQELALAAAILSDRGGRPVFPRWFAQLNLVSVVVLVPPLFDIFVARGVLAWDGFLTFWLPLAVFGAWFVAAIWLLLRAIDEDRTLSGRAAPGD